MLIEFDLWKFCDTIRIKEDFVTLVLKVHFISKTHSPPWFVSTIIFFNGIIPSKDLPWGNVAITNQNHLGQSLYLLATQIILIINAK